MIRERLISLREIVGHEMNAGRRTRAFLNYFEWNFGRRLLQDIEFSIELLAGHRVLLSNEENYATLAYTCRLYDFQEMLFLLHFLRPGDDFADCGANAGVYSVLAGTRGSRVLAVEPVPSTFEKLRRNLALNATPGQAINCGLGASDASLRFTTHMGGQNRVALDRDSGVVEVNVTSLDQLTCKLGVSPILIKVDVEGYEFMVLQGAKALLESSICALIIELNGSGAAYGYSDEAVSAFLRSIDFVNCAYSPRQRELGQHPVDWRPPPRHINQLFVKRSALEDVRDRLKAADKIFTRVGAI